jgi:hypothetical protein
MYGVYAAAANQWLTGASGSSSVGDQSMKYVNSNEDIEFKRQFESCEFPAAKFNHKAHLRLAYVYLAENDPDAAVALMRESLKRFLKHNGVDPTKYHETLTRAWILAVNHFMNKTGGCQSAEELIAGNPEMLDSKIMLTHYSAEMLFSDEARKAFVQPNLDPIPRYAE